MSGHLPLLDRDALARLRGLVAKMHKANGSHLPLDELLQLADDGSIAAGFTIDFEASRSLGDPMIVVRMDQHNRQAAFLAKLSRREREVVALIAEGHSNKEIARNLHLSLATVKDHVHRILSRTALPNRAAIASAYHGHLPARRP